MTLEELIGQFKAYVEYPDQYTFVISNQECKDILKYFTELEPKIGRWIDSELNANRSENFWFWECSECGWEIYDSNAKTNYCPSCGAKMAESGGNNEISKATASVKEYLYRLRMMEIVEAEERAKSEAQDFLYNMRRVADNIGVRSNWFVKEVVKNIHLELEKEAMQND